MQAEVDMLICPSTGKTTMLHHSIECHILIAFLTLNKENVSTLKVNIIKIFINVAIYQKEPTAFDSKNISCCEFDVEIFDKHW